MQISSEITVTPIAAPVPTGQGLNGPKGSEFCENIACLRTLSQNRLVGERARWTSCWQRGRSRRIPSSDVSDRRVVDTARHRQRLDPAAQSPAAQSPAAQSPAVQSPAVRSPAARSKMVFWRQSLIRSHSSGQLTAASMVVFDDSWSGLAQR